MKRIFESLLKFFVALVSKVTLLTTLCAIGFCGAMFIYCLFTGQYLPAGLWLVGMIAFVYVNKQF